jgi:hypothetical protein
MACRPTAVRSANLVVCLPVLQVQANPQNAPAWRLLGTVHAENDDDRQVRGGGGVATKQLRQSACYSDGVRHVHKAPLAACVRE